MRRKKLKRRLVGSLALVFGFLSPLLAFRATSRYFPFIERTEEYVTKGKSYIVPALFITSASTAFGREGGNAGIPELWGSYNLKEVICGLAALKNAQGFAGYNPFMNEVGYTDWNQKNMRFHVDGKVKSRGIILNAEQSIANSGFSTGFFLPIMHVNTSMRFTFDRRNSHADAQSATIEEEDMVNRVRRNVHCDLGLASDRWSKSGLGDLDVHVSWRRWWDHQFKLRTLEFYVRAGLLVPVGTKRDECYPTSVPFMGNGHWGAYLDFFAEAELRQDWKVGMLFGMADRFKRTSARRVSYWTEPDIFSALSGDMTVNPGMTYKFSTYITRENLGDGIHFQARYSYVKHYSDSWDDKRINQSLRSYLQSEMFGSETVRDDKRRLSSWRSHYISLQVTYDSVDAMKKWWLEPKFYALLDYAADGKGVSKTHQFTVGVTLHPW